MNLNRKQKQNRKSKNLLSYLQYKIARQYNNNNNNKKLIYEKKGKTFPFYVTLYLKTYLFKRKKKYFEKKKKF